MIPFLIPFCYCLHYPKSGNHDLYSGVLKKKLNKLANSLIELVFVQATL